MSEPKPEVAFIGAALMLVVMPLVVLVGVLAAAFAMRFGLLPQLNSATGAGAAVVWTAFAVWVLVVIAAILAVIARLSRRSTRP